MVSNSERVTLSDSETIYQYSQENSEINFKIMISLNI